MGYISLVIVYCLMCHQNIQSYGEVTISSEGLQNLGIRFKHLRPSASGGLILTWFNAGEMEKDI